MINEENREEFFQIFKELITKMHNLVKVSDNELARKFYNTDCVNSHNLLDKTDDPRRFLGEVSKLRQAWTSISNEVFEFEEAESVNIVLSNLERMVR